MRWKTTAVISVSAILLTGRADAQSLDENRERCTNATPDIAILACTAIIGSGQMAAEDLAGAFNNLGVAYAGRRESDRAIENYDRALRLNPNNAAAFNNRGVAYLDKREYDRAIQDFDQAIKLDPNYALAFSNRGVAYAGKAEYDRAIENYRQARKLNPNGAVDFYLHNLSTQKLGEVASGTRKIAGPE